VGFAPRVNPKIAIAVIIENGGYGASWAAPIASFVVEKYLKDSVTYRPSGIDVNRYIRANLLPALPVSKSKIIKKADSGKVKKPDSIGILKSGKTKFKGPASVKKTDSSKTIKTKNSLIKPKIPIQK
jgi:penicillin-binding protein 2